MKFEVYKLPEGMNAEIEYIKVNLTMINNIKQNMPNTYSSKVLNSYIYLLLTYVYNQNTCERSPMTPYRLVLSTTDIKKRTYLDFYAKLIPLLSSIYNHYYYNDDEGLIVDYLTNKVLFIDFNMLEFQLMDKPYKASIKRAMEFFRMFSFTEKTNMIPLFMDFISFEKGLGLKEISCIYEYNRFSQPSLRIFETSVLNRYASEAEPRVFNAKKDNKLISIEDIKAVYSIMDRNTMYEDWNKSHTMESKLDDGSYLFNPNMARIMHCNVVPTKTIFNILGEDENVVKDNLETIIKKKLDIVIVGLGGSMSNFVYWTERLAEYFGIKEHIFKSALIYEEDKLEVSNLFRIPLDYISPLYLKSINIDTRKGYSKALMMYNTKQFCKEFVLVDRYLNENDDFKRIDNAYDFIIGSPILKTRDLLSKATNKFICPLHSNNDLYIFENPKIENFETMIESYGSINLSYFFLNMFKMTLECLNLMATRKELLQDNLVLEYSSKNIDIESNLNGTNETIILY